MAAMEDPTTHEFDSKFVSAPLTVDSYRFTSEGSEYLHVRVSAPPTGSRQPVLIIAIIDNSGSMGENADIAGEAELGFTRLDLVKHAVRTKASILGPQDYLAIVTFSSTASIVMPPTCMNNEGKEAVSHALDRIVPDGSTNIYDGILKATELVNSNAFDGYNIVGMLLTDGLPNINPPRGIIPTLKSIRMANRWTLHTFGFGYNLDSQLLYDLSVWGRGLYGFIPDASMVGTVFINALAQVLSTAALNSSFRIRNGTDEETLVDMGPISFGQSRDYVLPISSDVIEVNRVPVLHGSAEMTVENTVALFHYKYKKTILAAVQQCILSQNTEATRMLAEFELTHSSSTNPTIKAMLRDIRSDSMSEGQIGLSPHHFTRWGKNYMLAYLRAQELQQCMNFKDPGLQIYGGELFHQLQDEGDRLFCSLPPPTPSGYRSSTFGSASAYAPVASMSIFHNASGGCFGPNTMVRMADHSVVNIKNIRRNDLVWTPSGPARVVSLVVCGSQNRSQPMSILNSLHITPWHPILHENVWIFPANLVGYSDRLVQTVYNLVLDSGHIILADDYLCVTLGHNFVGPVIEHPFFGSHKVIEDLAKMPGWDEGLVTFTNLVATHDDDTGLINGWIDVPVHHSS